MYPLLKSKIRSLKIRLKYRWGVVVRRVFYGSFSQYGEDMMISAMLGDRSVYYVDIGANHPTHLSNTYYFYRRGASGINIEPDPSARNALAVARPRDLNLWFGVGIEVGDLPFYRMSVSTLSTFDSANAEQQVRAGYSILETIRVPVRTLASILSEHRPDGRIDLLSIDVEGHEMSILLGNDWRRFRPTIIVMEINRNGDALRSFLARNDYLLVIDNGTNGIFLNARESRAGV